MTTLVLWACMHMAWAADNSASLRLLSRSGVIAADPQARQALDDTRVLRVGISEPDYPPFDITNHADEFEGISADYLGLIGQFLAVDVQIKRYRSREDVIQALKHGDIDLLTSANEFEASDPGLQLSQPYILDRPTLVERVHDAGPQDPGFAGKTIAMVNHYLPLSTVKTFYPDATVVLYPSIVAGVSAVAFAKADLYLGDSISTSYLINKSYLNNVQLLDYPGIKVNHFAFALARHNGALLKAVNAALQAIAPSEQMSIARRWNASDASVTGVPPLHFTSEETRWLMAHPQLKVIANEDFLPFSFFDGNGRLRGLSADILAKISLKTGLKFIPQTSTSIDEMIHTVSRGEADLVAALAPSPDREQQLSFSRPYSFAPLVLITRNEAHSPTDLGELAGKKLVIISGNSKQQMLEQQYPDIQIVTAENLHEAFAWVASGEVDAGIGILTSAHSLIAQHYQTSLKIASTVAGSGAQLAFAVNPDAPLLLSILNKSLLSISPEEMDEINNRWRSPMVLQSYWDTHRTTILQSFAVFAVLLILAGVWIVLLRRQVLRRKIAERALSDRLKFERVLIDGTPHPLYVRDREGRLLTCNSAYRHAFGLADEPVVLGQTVVQSALTDDDQAQQYHHDYLRAMASNTPQIQDRLLILPTGKVQTIQHWILPYQGNDGGVDGLIGGWVDVSDRQQLMEQLHAAKHQADKANSAKTAFLSTMSHEIRTPMNAILGMLEMASKKAEQGVLDLTAINVASEASRGLLALIGDILDISRIESGHKDLMPECGNPHLLLMGIVNVFDGLARQKNLQLVVDVEPTLDQHVMVDSLRFKQVVANLLSNAIKYTTVGHVRIHASLEPLPTPHTMGLRVIIEDTGVGISATDQQRLFTPFTQVGKHDMATGSGLGLAISRSLVEVMGGTLTLTSEEGQGTQVVLKLDLPVASSSTLPAAPAVHSDLPEGGALTVLIVDDYAANRMVLTQQLTYLGHQVLEAESGAHAWALWREQAFDVVVTDCNMPDMSGYELARLIRQHERDTHQPACLLLGFTANAVPEEKQRCLDAGMDDCLFKPVSLQHLNDQLQPLQRAYFADEHGDELCIEQIEQHLSVFTFGNAQVMQGLKDELLSSARADLQALTRMVRDADLPGLAEFAHRVKGAARLIQYEHLMVSCESLQALCEDTCNPQSRQEVIGIVQDCLQRLVECLLTSPSRPGA
ncbi:transporter substrate-binding domain-containing protein [Pseudomonas sp. SDO528_S397]